MPRILIVDDDKSNRDSMKLALGDSHPEWEISVAENEIEGKAKIEAALATDKPIDVVLTDLVMATEESGINMLREARKLDPLIMAILFTAKETSLDPYLAFDCGAYDVVDKMIPGQQGAIDKIDAKTNDAVAYRQSRLASLARRYFDPRLYDMIERDPSLLSIARRTVTIAFWDIRGFSNFCDIFKAYPEVIVEFLQEYCEMAARTIFRHGGLLDKFIGDGVMALFGVLKPMDADSESDALKAVRAAREMRTEFQRIQTKRHDSWMRDQPRSFQIGLGCGIHTGDVMVGHIATQFRDQFTALGHPVNLASRFEARAGHGEILLSEPTWRRVRKNIIDLEEATSMEINDIKNIEGVYRVFKA
jgi:class 3 adenylate cyclase